jgi:hypothetical protein
VLGCHQDRRAAVGGHDAVVVAEIVMVTARRDEDLPEQQPQPFRVDAGWRITPTFATEACAVPSGSASAMTASP